MSEPLHNLKKRIMRRVYLLFMLRNLAPLAFDCFGLAALAFVATFFVSIKHVIANLSFVEGAESFSRFSLLAFSRTELTTKILLFVLGAVCFLAVRDIRRAVRAARILKQGK